MIDVDRVRGTVGDLPRRLRAQTHEVDSCRFADSRLRVCMIGAGRIAEEHLGYLQRSEHARLVAVCDLDPVLAARAASRFADVRVVTDHMDMLGAFRPDAVHVVTPVGTHRRLVSAAVSSGVRLVIVEKPAGATLEDTEDMVREAEHVNAKLTEDHNYRFNSPVLRLESIASSGVLGTIREVDVRMAMKLGDSRYGDPLAKRQAEQQGGGVLREFLPHLAYLGLLFSPAARVKDIRWDKRDAATAVCPDDLDALLEDSDGSGPRVRLRFSSGVAPATTSLTVRGTRGWAEADLQNPLVRTGLPRDVGEALSPLVDQTLGGISLIRASANGFMAKLRGSPIYAGIGTFLDMTYASAATGAPLPVSHRNVLATARVIDDMTRPLEA